MPDGLYTTRGWQPLPFCESDGIRLHRKQRWTLIWGTLCCAAAMAGMVISGLLHRGKNTP